MADLCESNALTDQAAEHITWAIECGADWPDVHLHAADLLTRCKRTEHAKQHLLRALELSLTTLKHTRHWPRWQLEEGMIL